MEKERTCFSFLKPHTVRSKHPRNETPLCRRVSSDGVRVQFAQSMVRNETTVQYMLGQTVILIGYYYVNRACARRFSLLHLNSGNSKMTLCFPSYGWATQSNPVPPLPIASRYSERAVRAGYCRGRGGKSAAMLYSAPFSPAGRARDPALRKRLRALDQSAYSVQCGLPSSRSQCTRGTREKDCD
jgi:hypothetical protein